MSTVLQERKTFLSNSEPGFKVSIPITEGSDVHAMLNDQDSELYEIVREYLQDTVMEYARKEIGREPQGLFRYPEIICDKLYSRCDQLVQEKIIGKLCVNVWEDGWLKSSEPISLPERLYDLGRNCEVSAIETGATVLLRLEEFLKKGVWQIGFKCEDVLITDIVSFPNCVKDKNGRIEWINELGRLCEPIIWFGLPDKDPEEVWSLSLHINFDWRSFWFNDFWQLDWNALFGGYDNYYTVWMFCECGMEEPIDDFERVKSSCPIQFNVKDTDEQLSRKIQDYLLSVYEDGVWSLSTNRLSISDYQKKKESLTQALILAGYAMGQVYIRGNEDYEHARRLPDGRLDPHWLDDGFGDQMAEGMNEMEDYLHLDKTLFPGSFDRNVEQGTMPIWNDLLDLYFDYDEVAEQLCVGWDKLLFDLYGNNW